MERKTAPIFFVFLIGAVRAQLWSCNFDNGNLEGGCEVIQDKSDGSWDWILLNQYTPTSNTGPSSAYSLDWFFYFETSDPARQGDIARFTTPNLNYDGTACVDFWYHMYGASMGSLKLYVQSGSNRVDTTFLMSGNKGNQWNNARVEVTLRENTDKVGWQATKGNDIQSDIAVDSITISRGACTNCISVTTPIEISNVTTTKGQGDVTEGSDVTEDFDDVTTGTHVTEPKVIEVTTAEIVEFVSFSEGDDHTTEHTTQMSVELETTEMNAVFTSPASDTDPTATLSNPGNGGDNEESRPLPYGCTFEDSICGMSQSQDDNFDWERSQGGTATQGSGPSGASQGVFFLYTEMSSPRVTGDFARIGTPTLLASGDICVSFDYHAYGSSIGEFYVSLASDIDNKLLEVTSNLGNQWNKASINVNINSGDRVVFSAVKGTDVYSDFSIDDLQISSGFCDGFAKVELPFSCSFEDDNLCQMAQSEEDEFDWEINEGDTGTSDTGPSSASDGTKYIYTEMSSPRRVDDTAVISTPLLSYTGVICLQFDYHAFGENFGQFYVAKDTDMENRLLDVTVDQGDEWIPAALNVDIEDGEKIVFTAVRGSDVRGDVAVDNIYITAGSCTSTQAPPTTRTLPYSCSFETNICDMNQPTSDQFDWERLSTETPTSGTGPSQASDGEFFIYAEMSSPRSPEDIARLETPELDFDGQICVTFMYSAAGESIGRFHVTQSTNEQNVALDITTNQGSDWIKAELNFDIERNERIIFSAMTGENVYGDIAIDDLLIEAGTCGGTTTTSTTTTTTTAPPTTGQSLPYICTFEQDFCEMEQLTNDQFDWTRNSGETGTSNTGPSAAYQGSWYMYIEASNPRAPNDEAVIQTPQFGYSGQGCLRFAYSMYGQAINTFYVVQSSNTENRLLSEVGNQDSTWKTAEIDVGLEMGDRFIFYGVRGDSIEGDIAVDDLRVTAGRCEDDGPSPTDAAPVTQYVITSCTMEGDGSAASNCRITQDSSDNFDWTRATGKTVSGGLHNRDINGIKYPITGPSSARAGEYYFYTESSGKREGDVARLVLEGNDFRNGGDHCLRFAFSMNGYHIGSLKTYVRKSGERQYMWTLVGDQSPDWRQAAVDIDMDNVDEIGIEAVMSGDFSGDISVDDIEMSRGRCENIPSGYLWRCRFEMDDGASSFCGMSQDSEDQFDWTMLSGATMSEETGPTRASEGSYYIYIEASSPRQPGDTAKIFMPNLDRSGQMCLEFSYHMYGFHIGTLQVITRNTFGTETPEFQLVGPQGNQWRTQQVTLTDVRRDDLIGFVGIRADEFSGDIALDNVRIKSGRC